MLVPLVLPTVAHPEFVTYWYEGRCPRTGDWLRLPRTRLVEAIAQRLLAELASDPGFNQEGKMYGVLLAELPSGDRVWLKAFSGLLHGNPNRDGWVPPIPGRDRIQFAESQTTRQLSAIQQQIAALEALPDRQQYQQRCAQFEQARQQLRAAHQQNAQQRQQQRQVIEQTLSEPQRSIALAELTRQSQQDSTQKRRLKQQQAQQLQPIEQQLDAIDRQIQSLKTQRQTLSRSLQAQLNSAFWLKNFAGETSTLQELAAQLPTGTGDCCAPKLLHYAATHALKPIALAEFWWGAATADKQVGHFYGACANRCQPILGFLLSGLPPVPRLEAATPENAANEPIALLYEDADLVAVNKPAGLLSVPGRYGQPHLGDWLRQLGDRLLLPVHRLDQDTSGVLVLACHADAHRQLSQQFQQRQVEKLYEAIGVGRVLPDSGVLSLPLWGDPQQRPYQQVNWVQGKPSLTQFRVLSRFAQQTRLELQPVTGRTHQIRVHLADRQGLDTPILGDRLYGNHQAQVASDRLHLHARSLTLRHPRSNCPMTLSAETPF